MPQSLTIAQRLGSVPIDTYRKAAINIKTADVLDIARNILQNLPPHTLFRRGEEFLTVERAAAQDEAGFYPAIQRGMNSRRLRSWLLNYMMFQEGSGDDAKAAKLPKDLAETIISSDVFFSGVSELDEIAQVRMPVWTQTAEGRRAVTLAENGYNPRTGVYTVETLNYTTNLPRYKPHHLRHCWVSLMHSFPWRAESPAEAATEWKHDNKTHTGAHPVTNRSACACLATMLAQYCRYLFARAPMAIFNANQPGSGKSLLAWFCIAPTWGMAAGTAMFKNEEEMTKTLNATAKARKPYLMLDDIPTLANNSINSFATTPSWGGRNLGSDTEFVVKNNCQIIATGNGLNTTPDVERRSLIIDLFLEENALQREIESPLTKEKFNTPGFRADMLGFLWSMVANWSDAGCPVLVKGSEKNTFEEFAETVGSIMVFNGFGNPFRERVTDGEGGDLIGRALTKLLAHIAAEHIVDEQGNPATSRRFTLDDIMKISDAIGYTETITGGKEPRRSLGKKLVKLRGRKCVDEQGRAFYFGKGEDAASSFYTFSLVDWSQPATPQTQTTENTPQ